MSKVKRMKFTTRMNYRSYREVDVKLIFTKPLLGGHIASAPYWLNGKPSDEFDELLHRTDDNKIVILRGQFRGLIREMARLADLPETLENYVFCKDAEVHIPQGKSILQVTLPVIARFRGAGLKRHEACPPGSWTKASFKIPTSVIPVEKFLEVLRAAGERIGLGAERKRGFGSFTVERAS